VWYSGIVGSVLVRRGLGKHLDTSTPLDAAHSVTLTVREGSHDVGLMLEGVVGGGVFEVVGVGLQVDKLNVAVRGGNNEKAVGSVHGVDTLLTDQSRKGRAGVSDVPVAHRLVPRPRRDNVRRGVRDFDKAQRADGRVVRDEGCCLAGSGGEKIDFLSGTSSSNNGAILDKWLERDGCPSRGKPCAYL